MEKFDWYGKNDAVNAYLVPSGKTVASLSDDSHPITAELVIQSSGVLRYQGEVYESPKVYPKKLKDILAHDAYGVRHASAHNEGLDILTEASATVKFSVKEPRKARIQLNGAEYQWLSPIQQPAWADQTHLQDEVLDDLRNDLRVASIIYDYLQHSRRIELTSSVKASIHDLSHAFAEAGEFLCGADGRVSEDAAQSDYVRKDERYSKCDVHVFDMAKAYFGERDSSCLTVESVDRGYLNFYLGQSCFFQKTPFDRAINVEEEIERRLQDIYLGQDCSINRNHGEVVQNTLLMRAALSHYMEKAHEWEAQKGKNDMSPKHPKKTRKRTRAKTSTPSR